MLDINKTSQLSQCSFSPKIEQLAGILKDAAGLARAVKDSSDYEVMIKPDGSYVTSVDLRVSDFLKERLIEIHPGSFISEEDIPPYDVRRKEDWCWIIDPIDNTQGLVEIGIEQSCINVALFKNGIPKAAAIHYFSDDSTYIGTFDSGVTVYKDHESLQLDPRKAALPLRYVAYMPNIAEMSELMRETLLPYLDNGGEIIHRGKLPLRFRSLLDGEADIYIEPREIKEWDVAAGMVLAQFLGARLSHLNQEDQIQFNTESLRCSPFILTFEE